MTLCYCPNRFPLLLQVRDLSMPTAWRTPSNRRAGLRVPGNGNNLSRGQALKCLAPGKKRTGRATTIEIDTTGS
ncbi:hypothetical protein Taro_010156 [Colocasia esculenta]|uniref:Uncharacterized protein n=1 Tax=Colocasia esculenta TaxID=4460 RepID=A0A843U6W4_COLES|nr:hypothetical protein [Colocasia esculenta]